MKKKSQNAANDCSSNNTLFDEEKHEKVLIRLRRLNGQIGGIIKMIENNEKGCKEIVQQIKASRSAIDTVGKMVIACYFEKCIENETDSDEAMNLLMNF